MERSGVEREIKIVTALVIGGGSSLLGANIHNEVGNYPETHPTNPIVSSLGFKPSFELTLGDMVEAAPSCTVNYDMRNDHPTPEVISIYSVNKNGEQGGLLDKVKIGPKEEIIKTLTSLCTSQDPKGGTLTTIMIARNSQVESKPLTVGPVDDKYTDHIVWNSLPPTKEVKPMTTPTEISEPKLQSENPMKSNKPIPIPTKVSIPPSETVTVYSSKCVNNSDPEGNFCIDPHQIVSFTGNIFNWLGDYFNTPSSVIPVAKKDQPYVDVLGSVVLSLPILFIVWGVSRIIGRRRGP